MINILRHYSPTGECGMCLKGKAYFLFRRGKISSLACINCVQEKQYIAWFGNVSKEVITMSSNPYNIPSKPTRFTDKWNGQVLYPSIMEARAARVFLRDDIEFKPHVKFVCFDRQGKQFNYTVDFLFARPQKLAGISKWVTFIETKGALTKHDILRLDALEYCHELKGFIVTEPLLQMWEKEGTQ